MDSSKMGMNERIGEAIDNAAKHLKPKFKICIEIEKDGFDCYLLKPDSIYKTRVDEDLLDSLIELLEIANTIAA